MKKVLHLQKYQRGIFSLHLNLTYLKKENIKHFSKTFFFLLYCCKKKLHKQQKTSVDLNIDDIIVILSLFLSQGKTGADLLNPVQ